VHIVINTIVCPTSTSKLSTLCLATDRLTNTHFVSRHRRQDSSTHPPLSLTTESHAHTVPSNSEAGRTETTPCSPTSKRLLPQHSTTTTACAHEVLGSRLAKAPRKKRLTRVPCVILDREAAPVCPFVSGMMTDVQSVSCHYFLGGEMRCQAQTHAGM
jgi:hypothetical protein